jgi:heme/copper-type cytochrome/quinol oxidase subunit 2
MWGGIYTESSYQLNFNSSFSTTRSDVLVHLSQWQYWWWFWFAFIWTFYYLVITKIVRHRSLKMRPRIATSFRPHGKWGDFVAAIIPTVWCINIICNSNFILRLIEWQTESSLLTIRVRARQWYWVYKLDAKSIVDIFTVPKNIGRDKWLFSNLYDIKTSESYMDLIELRSQNDWLRDYWNSYLMSEDQDKKEPNIYNYDKFDVATPLTIVSLNTSSNKNILNLDSTFTFLPFNGELSNNTSILSNSTAWNDNNSTTFLTTGESFEQNIFSFFNFFKFNESDSNFTDNYLNIGQLFNSKNSLLQAYNSISCLLDQTKVDFKTVDFIDNSRFFKRTQGIILPFRLTKHLINSSNTTDLLTIQWGSGSSTLKHKIKPYTTYLTFKQKRYKRKKFINFTTKNVYIDDKLMTVKWKPVLVNNRIFSDSEIDPTIAYKMIKKLKKKDDAIPLVLSKRLLRVKRTLVLPAHINLTVITSSYDIIHSWFIPGLGLKLDCVPGRSTHHTFYIDNVGFYIGQCAEICGRYHHHMPIRVCALPFDHFLTWWYHFGLPKLMFTNSSSNFNYGFRKYSW